MKFHHYFIAVSIASLFVIFAFYIHSQRPKYESREFHADAKYVKASGKCVSCHRRETSSIVHQFEMSKHVKAGINCLDCHKNHENQIQMVHHGFTLTEKVTSLNCKSCHQTEYSQFVRSRHAGPSWAAVRGAQDFTRAQLIEGEKYHPGTIDRPPNALAHLEAEGSIEKGCMGCHAIGRPNQDGSIGNCTECHSTHSASVAMARKPKTCAQCHMGPDHAQYEIYSESKHGAYYNHFKDRINFEADPKKLTTRDFPVPVCSTCHMSGLEGMEVTHDVSKRLSWYLFQPVSKKRKQFQHGRDSMKEMCLKCHTQSRVNKFYELGDVVVESTNKIIKESQLIMERLKREKKITKEPFDEDIEFLAFDIWHYYGRTAKHGAFMGGADFVQWHGNYELLRKMVKLKAKAKKLQSK